MGPQYWTFLVLLGVQNGLVATAAVDMVEHEVEMGRIAAFALAEEPTRKVGA